MANLIFFVTEIPVLRQGRCSRSGRLCEFNHTSAVGPQTLDQSVGAAIAIFIQGTQKERPLPHDLLANILRALGAKIERAIVNDLKLGVDGTSEPAATCAATCVM